MAKEVCEEISSQVTYREYLQADNIFENDNYSDLETILNYVDLFHASLSSVFLRYTDSQHSKMEKLQGNWNTNSQRKYIVHAIFCIRSSDTS